MLSICNFVVVIVLYITPLSSTNSLQLLYSFLLIRSLKLYKASFLETRKHVNTPKLFL